jgi:hypothetical protein
MVDDKMPEKHESYGTLEISRCQCPSAALFGSSILHENTIRIRISAAELQRKYHTDYVHSSLMRKGTYVEVEMSYAQFAEAITSLNIGAGIPVTVRCANGRQMEPCPFTSKDEQFRAEFSDDLKGLAATVNGAVKRAEALFDSKKPLNRAEKDELLSMLKSLSTAVNSNIPFVRDSFAEQMDKTVLEAKGNIEGFIQNRMAAIANAAIAQNLEALDCGSGAAALLKLGGGSDQPSPQTGGGKPSVLEQIRAGVPPRGNRPPNKRGLVDKDRD